ncbi:putative metal-dependent hydrolase family protein [Mycobacterium xenopi 4042]|uniref:Putative metal-dependent hydrolase family protein n=1 Tax=Mycobacterium xenopi 4042 TaxID=1299334 RepID=X8CGU0_MYCXE|nr:putative metal-dependent hydrolase family protein [Mycobacterium xenopi 3993]EUA54658.1 putative metal-dependent hydrolase family protein [Mycobacterium xenopi 4042]
MFTVDDQAAGPHDASLDHERIVLQARDVEFDWANLPFYYVPNEPFATHFCNVLHLLLPAGEEWIVEVFKKALPLIQDDQLRLDVQGFLSQEAMHSQAHAGVLEHFAANGIDVTPFTDQIRWLFTKLIGDRPGWGPNRRQRWLAEQVSIVAAIEHYTAILGNGFSTPRNSTRSAPTQ